MKSTAKLTDEMPADVRGLESIKPRYTNLKGWRESTEGIAEFDKLPQAARDYLRFQERESGARIGMVSTGPGSRPDDAVCPTSRRRSPKSTRRLGIPRGRQGPAPQSFSPINLPAFPLQEVCSPW